MAVINNTVDTIIDANPINAIFVSTVPESVNI
jgi:hypothetical protein